MAMLPLCRVCLSDNVTLCSVKNIHLTKVYEKLTDSKYNKAGYPVSMCYICLSVLRKCHRFMETARDASNVLEQWYNGESDLKLKKQVLYKYTTYINETTTIGNPPACNIKTEDSDNIDTGNTTEDIPVTGNISRQGNQNGKSYVDTVFNNCTKINIKNEDCISNRSSNKTYHGNIKNTRTKNSKELNKKSSNTDTEIVDNDVASSSSDMSSSEDIPLSSNISRKRKLLTKQKCGTGPKKKLTEKSEALHKIILSNKYINTNHSKKYSCKHCNYKCHTKQLIHRHLKTHAGETLFSCDICSYKCRSNDILLSHYRNHTGERLFFCNFCDFKCTKSHSLVRHLRTHTDETPYSCHLCGYRCSQQNHLENHIRCHIEEKLLSCDQCDRVIKSLFANQI